MRDRQLTPRPGAPREFGQDIDVDSRLGSLEVRLENGEGELKKFRESYEGFKKSYQDDRREDAAFRLSMADEMGRMAGASEATRFWVKIGVTLLGIITAAVVTALVSFLKR